MHTRARVRVHSLTRKAQIYLFFIVAETNQPTRKRMKWVWSQPINAEHVVINRPRARDNDNGHNALLGWLSINHHATLSINPARKQFYLLIYTSRSIFFNFLPLSSDDSLFYLHLFTISNGWLLACVCSACVRVHSFIHSHIHKKPMQTKIPNQKRPHATNKQTHTSIQSITQSTPHFSHSRRYATYSWCSLAWPHYTTHVLRSFVAQARPSRPSLRREPPKFRGFIQNWVSSTTTRTRHLLHQNHNKQRQDTTPVDSEHQQRQACTILGTVRACVCACPLAMRRDSQ